MTYVIYLAKHMGIGSMEIRVPYHAHGNKIR